MGRAFCLEALPLQTQSLRSISGQPGIGERHDLLHGVAEPGDGDVHREVREAQRRFFDPPADMSRQPAQLRKIAR